MKKIAICLSLLVAYAGAALADGNAQAGKDKAAACAACHGADGNSPSAAFPKLAGQHAKYLVKQMQEIQSGIRPVPTMAGQLDGMSDQDLADIAAFFAGQSVQTGKANPELVAMGERLYRAGNKDTGVAACTACHSPTGSGNGPAAFPALGGQHAGYIAAQLKAFRAGDRVNDGDAKMMRSVAFRLNDREIEAVSSYISGLH